MSRRVHTPHRWLRCKTILAWAVEGCFRWQRNGLTPLKTVRDRREAYSWDLVRMRRPPTASDAIDPMEESFTWLLWLARDDARLVSARASGMLWKVLAWRAGMSRATPRRHYVAAKRAIAVAEGWSRAPASSRTQARRVSLGCAPVGELEANRPAVWRPSRYVAAPLIWRARHPTSGEVHGLQVTAQAVRRLFGLALS